MRNMGGSSILAIGTDFDVIGGKLAIADISGMEKLWDALLDAGFSHSELEGMWQKDELRVLSA
ncbi:MAG: membrane dipeptidase [Sphaerochaeta sp.]